MVSQKTVQWTPGCGFARLGASCQSVRSTVYVVQGAGNYSTIMHQNCSDCTYEYLLVLAVLNECTV